MAMRVKSLFLAMAGLFVANLAGAQEPDGRSGWVERQQKFNRRIESSNRRATRSICADLCRETRRPADAELGELVEPVSTGATAYERARTPYEMQMESEGLVAASE